MFCYKCGEQLPEGGHFCPKCGERIIEMQEQNSSADFVNLTISIANAETARHSKRKFPVHVDGLFAGAILAGGSDTCQIQPGSHFIKIDTTPIEIFVSEKSTPITLNYVWGENINPKIICQPPQIVIRPSGRWSTENIVGTLCSVLGLTCIFVCSLSTPSYEGSIITAEQHMAMSRAMDFSLPLLIGGVVFGFVGAVFLIFSNNKNKKVKRFALSLASLVALGVIAFIAVTIARNLS